MANEFKHSTVGSQLSQTEYESTTGHVLDSQAAGDIIYASSTSQLSRLGIGTAGKVLEVSSGIPAWTAAVTGVTSVLNTSLAVGRDADNDIDFGTDNNIIFRAAGADQIKLVDGVLQPVTDSDVDLGTTGVRFKDAFIDSITTTGNVTVGGDLTITGDDLFMGTNTAGHLLIADGTNFNPTAVGDLSEISTVASDDVLLAVDTSGGGLKKITRSTLVSGLATSSGIGNVVEDTSPELGGDLDVLTHGIVTGASNRNIALTPHGTGVVRIDGTNGVDIESGAISIKNSGAESYVRFYCESSNAHYTQLQASPHSAYSGNVTVVLPAAATNLVGDDTTQTLTNKTLTSPKINEDVALTSTATELNLLDGVSGLVQADFTKLAAIDATATELNIMDGNTSVGTTAVADGDGIVTNDGGTMKQTSVETFATYFGSEITAMSNLVTTGTLNSGAISSGFGNIDIGSSTFDTTGSVGTGTITVADDSVINMGDEGQLIFGDTAPSADHKATGVVVSMNSGESVTAFNAVYIRDDGEVGPADADAATTMPAIGVALESKSDGQATKILISGVLRDDTYNFTPGADLFIGTTAGEITATAPSGSGDTVQKIGVALTADSIYVNFNTTEVLLA